MNDETQLSNNALVRAKQEGERQYRDLIEHNPQAAARLQELASNIYRETAHLAALREAAALQVGQWIADAYATLGNSHNSLLAWWNDPKTWEQVSGSPGSVAPFPSQKAYSVKRLADFCSGAIPGKGIGRPKNPEGFTDDALLELTAPKYVRDERGNELLASGDERTPESQARMDVVSKVYSRLRERARDRSASAKERGVEPVPITKHEVVDALQQAFKAANMVVVHRAVRRTSLKDMLDKIDRTMNAWYFTFEGDAAAAQAMRDKIAECLAEWDAWEAELNAR